VARYIQKGAVIDYTNTTEETILWGDIVILPSRIGVAECEIQPGAAGSISLTGIYEMETAETIGYGDAVYWDAASKTVTKTADKNIPAGMAASETGASGGKIAVRID